MSNFSEKSQRDEGSLGYLKNVRVRIRRMDTIEVSIRDEILHDLKEVANEIVHYRSHIRSLESNLESFLKSGGFIDEYTLKKDVTNYKIAEKSLFENLFGGILVNRRHFERAVRLLQRKE